MFNGVVVSTGKVRDLLVIDDDIGQVQLLRLLLTELGLPHRCHAVHDGRKALDFLHHQGSFGDAPRPDLILLDLNMPGMAGCEVLSRIKHDPELRNIPVIILSQSRDRADVIACYGERANAYIAKPADLDSNLELVQELERFWLQTASLPK